MIIAVTICRDQVKQMELEKAQYEDTNDIVESLLRYDLPTEHRAYYIRGYNYTVYYPMQFCL